MPFAEWGAVGAPVVGSGGKVGSGVGAGGEGRGGDPMGLRWAPVGTLRDPRVAAAGRNQDVAEGDRPGDGHVRGTRPPGI
ncbi:hypothetical protein GCM10009836_15080 [Pseudonocardia ailaonensis]|uniref:Uncharacterized protein n=1 Tax=Pseudonocardia ailaonensis TaxID=367279 RepID=A0ABN2MSM3_9PSEU